MHGKKQDLLQCFTSASALTTVALILAFENLLFEFYKTDKITRYFHYVSALDVPALYSAISFSHMKLIRERLYYVCSNCVREFECGTMKKVRIHLYTFVDLFV